MSSGRAESGNALIHVMVGADRPGYPGDKGRAYSSGREGRRRVQKNRREKDSRVGADEEEGMV